MANSERIYLIQGNDTDMSVCLRKGGDTPLPYDLTGASRIGLALTGHGLSFFARDIVVSGEDNNIISGLLAGDLLVGEYGLEVSFTLDGKAKRFRVPQVFEVVTYLSEDQDGTAEGEGDGISITVTVQPEVIEIAGPTGPQGKSAYQVWLEDDHTGDEDDFFRWLAAQTPNPDWAQNDASEPDYVENRTHYDIPAVSLPDAFITFRWTEDDYSDLMFYLNDETPMPRMSENTWGVQLGQWLLSCYINGNVLEIDLDGDPILTVANFRPGRTPQPISVGDIEVPELVQQLDGKYLALKTVNGQSVKGSGDITLNGSNLEYTGNDGEYISGGDSINSSLLLLDEAVDETNGRIDNLKGSEVVYDGEDGDSVIVHGDTVDQCLKGLDDQAAYIIENYQYKIPDLDTIRAGAALGATAYQKPSTGIPKSALASAVKTSLEKADTALQPSDLNGYATEGYVDQEVYEQVSGKQDTLVSGTNIKTINNESLLGSGNIDIQGGSADAVKYTEQTLTDAQKTQARTNIAAASDSEVSQLRSDVDEMDTHLMTFAEMPTDTAISSLHAYMNTSNTFVSVTQANYYFYMYLLEAGKTYRVTKTNQPEGVTRLLIKLNSQSQFAIGETITSDQILLTGSKSNGDYYYKFDEDTYIAIFNTLYVTIAEESGYIDIRGMRSDVDELSVELDKQEHIIDESIIQKKSYSIADFLNGYTNTSSSSTVIGSTFNFVNTTTPMSDTSNGGQFHIAVKKGDYVLAKMKSTSNQYCMAYVILDTDRKILSWAGKASNNFNWLANPKRFDIEQDGYLVLQMQRADYSDNVSAPLQIIHGTPVSLADLSEQVEEISEYLEGAIINSPTIQNSKAIIAPEGTISSSGATNIYTEIIPSGTEKIWTKFNSYGTPNNIGYAFYDSNDSLLQCGGSLAGSDANKNGVWLGLSVPEGAVKFANTVAYVTQYGLVKFDYEGIKTTGLETRVSALEEEVFGDETYSPKFHLPARLDFIKGEDVLLFKTAMGNNIAPGDIYCKNANCRDFPRYVEVTPTTAGESYIEFDVLNEDAGKVKTATVKLNVFEKPSNPSNTLNILVVGSSTTSNYANQYEELYRRLVLTTGEDGNPSNPKGLGLANVTFVGRKVNSGHFRYEATGGYSWGNYADPQGTSNNYAFTVDNPSAFVVGDVYTDGTYDFEISEISQDDNRISAKCATQNAPISSSGSLSLKTGTGPAALVYSAFVATITHPFDLGNGVSLSDYMDAYCGGVSPDIVVFQDLVFNSGGILTDAIKTKISTLFGIIHTEYPNAKILMSSEALPSLVGGLGANYKAGSAFGQPLVMAWRLRKLVSDTISFIDDLNESFGGEVVMFIPKAIQCDAEYDYPTTTKAVNLRVTNVTEEVGTNGMHPTTGYGIYNQIDSYYRAIAYAIKKWYN